MFISVSKQGRYAKVLLSFCENEIQAVDVYETMRLLKSLLEKRYRRLPRFLNPSVLRGVLETSLSSMPKNNVANHSLMLRKFILFLNHAKRIDLLEKIILAFQQMMVVKYNSIFVNMDVSPYLSKEQLSVIKAFVASKLNKRVSYKISIDPTKLMGFSMNIMRNIEIHANFANFIKRIQYENCQ